MMGSSSSRSLFKFAGRLWKTDKVISFWDYPSKLQLDKIIGDIEESGIKINNTWKIDINWRVNSVNNKLVNIDDYDKSNVKELSKKEREKMHVLSPLFKRGVKRENYGSDLTAKNAEKSGYKTSTEYLHKKGTHIGESFEQYLNEMPHIEWGPGREIDLEIELYDKKPQNFIEKMKNILIKKHHEDKYGGVVNIDDSKNMKSFIKSLKNNTTLMYWLENKGMLDKFKKLIQPYEI
jgi:hypothetical protein